MKPLRATRIIFFLSLIMAAPAVLSAQNNTWETPAKWRGHKQIVTTTKEPVAIHKEPVATPKEEIVESKEQVVITITEGDSFSQCFKACDTDNDNKVSVAEAKDATTLTLDKGEKSNIVDNYACLRHFPNIISLTIGNTSLESIDLRMLTKLERLDITNATSLKEVKLSSSC